MRTALLFALPAALLLASAPAARADDDYELPRHRPRLTDPDAFDDGSDPARRKSRRHDLPIESDDSGWDDEDTGAGSDEGAAIKPWETAPTADPAPRDPAPAYDGYGRDDSEAGFRDEGRRDEGRRDRRRERYDDDAEWRDDPGRRTLTAEEELRWDERRPKRLSGLDEPGNGVSAELTLGAMLLDDATEGVRGEFAFGLGFVWQFGRLFAPENKLLHNGLFLEAAYLHPLATKYGTESVQVESGQHHLSLAVMAGYPFKLLTLYGKVGPAMFVQPVSYDVQGSLTEWTGVKGGLVYGIGARKTVYLRPEVGISGRVELTRYRRGYLDDTLLSAAVGVAF